MSKDLEKILIYHRTKHKHGDFSKSDWIHLLNDLRDREKQLTIHSVVFNEAENCTRCLKPKRMKPNTIQMLCECDKSEVELFCGKENKDCKYLKKNNKCGLRKRWCAYQTK